jgi:hypothetical protein
MKRRLFFAFLSLTAGCASAPIAAQKTGEFDSPSTLINQSPKIDASIESAEKSKLVAANNCAAEPFTAFTSNLRRGNVSRFWKICA